MKISNRCYAVTGLGYSAPWCVNAGFITGDKTTLVVDTGGNSLGAATVYGYASAARSGNELLVINTEKHFDHIGGNSFFRQRGVDIWGHVAIQRTDAEFGAEIAEFNEGIPNLVRRERQEARVFFGGTSLALPNQTLDADMHLELGNCRVEVLLTPGHTDANISVWVPDDGVLYTGDCLINGYLANLDAGMPADWRTWLQSLDRLAALRPSVVMAGHGPIATGSEVERIFDEVRSTLLTAIERRHSPTSPH
jgi:glyoxylase-like metal-dependent hydrolase (beta-lactamase superfamily II)